MHLPIHDDFTSTQPGYARALARDLAAETTGEVRFDAGSRAAWSTDASNYRHVPIGVVLPRTIDDVIRTVALCRKYGAPITSRGGGTSLAGQTCNVAVIIDCSKYFNRDPRDRSGAAHRARRAGMRPRRSRAAAAQRTASPSAPTPPRTIATRWAG